MLEIKFTKKMDLKGYTLIEGFPGIGWVATIGAGHLIEQLKMEEVGYVESNTFPPITVILKGKPSFPVRLYADKKNKILVMVSEFVVPGKAVYPLTEEIIKLVKKHKLKQVMSLAGITSLTNTPNKVYGISTNKKITKLLTDKKITPVQEGVTTGVSGILLSLCANNNINGIGVLVPTMQKIPDPAAAATLVEKVSEILSLNIDIKELRKEAEKIQEKVKNMAAQVEKSKKQYEGKPPYPSIYG